MQPLSLVWTTVVLLILLLPGFLFFVGLYSKDRMSRDVAPGSVLTQLSGVALIAFFTHGMLYLLLLWACHFFIWLPCISISGLAATMQLTDLDGDTLSSLDLMFQYAAAWILAYVLGTCALGFSMGLLVAYFVVNGHLRNVARHGWIYDLLAADTNGGLIHAFVLTHIREANRVLTYRGYLRDFYFSPDGRIAYLVLKTCRRYYLVLDEQSPRTSDPKDWKTIGATHGPDSPMQRHWSYFMIEGEDIANVVFDAYRRLNYSTSGRETLQQALTEVQNAVRETSAPRPGRRKSSRNRR
jgi:hypothetical protein